ncbi:hypothetical protein C8Q77DRAFT_1068144 [Trametes polyzona]|nr:hypothetical protein C8Q77DRAFT_1068144 [Trametes polyzona]
MGQRHQAWLIARLKGRGDTEPRYRCIGGIHDQWCYGSLPLKAVIRMTALLKQELNAQIVEEELSRYTSKNESQLDEPCPYTTFLLNLAFNADLDRNSLGGCYMSNGGPGNVLPATWGCWDGDNNDGLTVFDVTDPRNPKYCLLPKYGSGSQFLNGEMYLRAYYEIEKQEPGFQSQLLQVLKAVDDIPLLDPRAVAEAWPREYRSSSPPVPEERNSEDVVPSLVTLTLVPAVKRALESEDELDALRPLVTHHDKLPAVWEVLRTIEAPFPDTGLPLISAILQPSGALTDLRGVQLSGAQLIKVVPANAVLDVLDLSGNAALDADGLRALLAHAPRIRRLVLFRTSISDEDLLAMLETPTIFGHVEELIHPLLHSWRADPWPGAFTVTVLGPRWSWPREIQLGLPLLSVPQLTQNIGILVNVLVDPESGHNLTDVTEGALEAMLSAGRIPEGTPWAARPVWSTPVAVGRVPSPGTLGGWRLVLSCTGGAKGRKLYGLVHSHGDELEAVAYSPDGFLRKLHEQGYPAPSDSVSRAFLAIFDKLKAAGMVEMTTEGYRAIQSRKAA